MAKTLIGNIKGPKGEAASLSIGNVTTVSPGSSASVSNRGDEHHAILDFTIPEGAKGAVGERGPRGERGERGPQGQTGAQGVKGDKGEPGTPGVNSFATAQAAGIVRASDDIDVNPDNGAMSIKNTVIPASGLENIATGETHRTVLGKVSAAIKKLIEIAGNYLTSRNIVNQEATSTDTAPSSALFKLLAGRVTKAESTIDVLNAKTGQQIQRKPITTEGPMFFYLAQSTTLGSKVIPAHTRGVYVGGNGSGALMCVDLNGNFYAAFQNNGTWVWKM